jgi:hypothetical protein
VHGFNKHTVKAVLKKQKNIHHNKLWAYAHEDFEHREKFKVKQNTQVQAVHKDTKEYLIFKNMMDVAKNNFDRKLVGLCCKGVKKDYKNYIWSYKE